ncbi:hypothetical protein IQ06DRAFT_98085 [Phaeosphaeriaceae sp. SRC1lsM3a]|nr:hypothetical protein IQ06DRAFT_98085 [Stagonospora sp. SRC1lsM3a]
MCFDDRDTYKIRTYVRNGARFEEEYTRPRHGMSWRRKYGFGGSYYPSRYYSRRPTGHFITNVLVPPYGHPGYRSYPPRIMGGGHAGYSSGYGRYFADNRVAMPRHAAVRSYYSTVPTYGYAGGYGYGYPATQAHVYPPGPTTTTTTYHVMNGHQVPATTAHCRHTTSAPAPVREDYQTENRRVAAERGAYDARPIKPADARSDDPFWCRERNGEWHLRTYYQIENECYPGRWAMDAELGFLVFQRA